MAALLHRLELQQGKQSPRGAILLPHTKIMLVQRGPHLTRGLWSIHLGSCLHQTTRARLIGRKWCLLDSEQYSTY